MLTKRLIPCLDVSNGQVVKGVQFENVKALADPVELGAFYASQGADELVFYDISASVKSRSLSAELVSKIAEKLSIPFTVGGGIRTLEDFYMVLGAGADKVSINSAALTTPQLITEGAKRFGSQCVVVSLDVRKTGPDQWEIYTAGGRKATGLCPFEWASKVEALGAGELVLNAIHTDGMQSGYDIELTRRISERVKIPVVASGGAGCPQDFLEVLTDGKADAALAASVFHTKSILLPNLKSQLKAKGLSIRI